MKNKFTKIVCFPTLFTIASSFVFAAAPEPSPYNSAIFNPIYFRPCTTIDKKCFNSFNKKMNELLSQGKTAEALGQCEGIRFWDSPALKMPETYLLCAEEGYIRQRSELAFYYQTVEKNPKQAVYWAETALGVVKKANGQQVPHPDSWKAWESLCSAYYLGEGVNKDFGKAKEYCKGAMYGDSKNPNIIVSKYAQEIVQIISTIEKQKQQHLYETLEEMEFLHQLERARNNWK